MRLPYLQVTQETWSRARALAGALGVDRHRAMSLIVDLWAWAIDLGREDSPPTGEISGAGDFPAKMLAGAVDWTGNAETLVTALCAAGLLEVVGNNLSLRVRGMDRYRRTWEKNRRRGHGKDSPGTNPAQTRQEPARESAGSENSMPPGANPAGTRAGPGENPAVSRREPARQTQTQTQTQKKEETREPFFVAPQPTTPNSPVPQTADWKSIKSEAACQEGDSLQERLQWAWEAVRGSKYRWDGFRDGKALHVVLEASQGHWDTIVAVWQRALARDYPRCRHLKDLADNWSEYAGAEPRRAQGRGALSEADKDWAARPQKTIQTPHGEELDL